MTPDDAYQALVDIQPELVLSAVVFVVVAFVVVALLAIFGLLRAAARGDEVRKGAEPWRESEFVGWDDPWDGWR